MKKFGFYAAALAFCVLLVGVVAVSSPIEAEAFNSMSPSADIEYGVGGASTDLFDSNGNPKSEYWVFDETGALEAAESAPAAGSAYIRARLVEGDIMLTLSNVKPAENSPLSIHAGNTDVIIELTGENVLRSNGSPALYIDRLSGAESNLTITGDGSLTCLGEGSVNDPDANGSVGAAVYAKYDLTVTGGAKLYACADEADADTAGSGNGGTARAILNVFKYGVYVGGDLKVEAGTAVTGVGADIISGEGGYLESYGVYAEGVINVDGTLKGTGGDVTGANGSPSSCGVSAAESADDGLVCSFSGSVTAVGGKITAGSGDSYGLRLNSSLDIEAVAVVNATGGDAANGSSYGAFVDEDVSVAGEFMASAGDAESPYSSYSCGLYVLYSDASVTVASTGSLIASGRSAGCTGGTGSTSAGLWIPKSVTIDGYAKLTGGNATVTEGDSGIFPATAGSYGLYAANVTVNGKLVAESGEAGSTAEDGKDAAAYSAGIWAGDLSIAAGAEAKAASGRAESDGSETVSAGVYLDPIQSSEILEGVNRPDGSGSSGDGGGSISSGDGDEEERAVCGLTVDGRLSATGGTAAGSAESGKISVSAGIYFPGSDDYEAAGFTVNSTGVVTATGSSAGVDYAGPVTVKDGAHVIFDASGTAADYKAALDAAGGLTLPSDYSWRTDSNAPFTLSSAEEYEYEFATNNDIYVEIAPPSAPATDVTLDESSLVLDEGETARLTAAVAPEDTTDEVTWSSSNPDVATVDENGLVTAVGPGRTVITAAAGSVSAECSVTVRSSGSVDVGPTYEIELDEGIVGGEIKTSLTNASAGSTIRVTATPDAGFELVYITLDGERISGTSFTMPARDVTVSAVFTRGEGFADVAPGSWYYDAVAYAAANGLMDGVSETEFDPDGVMTRAMVWAILGRLDGAEISGSGWLEAARAWALESGVSDGTEPDAAVTREMLVTMLHRFAGESASAADLNGYADGGEVSDWARDAFSWAIEHMIITGVDDDTLAPRSSASRAQCAAILMRFAQI